jgi:hypothetical protein
MKWIASLALLLAGSLGAQTAASAGGDTWSALSFLKGTWQAKTLGGAAEATVTGEYTFVMELKGHILARHTSSAACKGPADFDCEHGDLLYVYQDAPGQPLKAIYFDNEGHAIHYDVSTPAPNRAVFVSDASLPGPRFRLAYELKGAVMSGKFETLMPGRTEWKSYLEWSGTKVSPAPSAN